MNRLPSNRPGRWLLLLGSFLLITVLGWAESRVWVQYAPGGKGPVMAALKQAGGRVHYEFDNIGAVAVSLPEQALNGISRNPHVLLVEADPVRTMSAQTVPYGITMVQAPAAIAAGGTGSGITVGVIDSGIVPGHEDFAGLTIAGDSSVAGPVWNADLYGHGTHVAGTIAAANNSLGVVGVAPGIQGLYIVRVFGDNGAWAYSSDLLRAVQRAVSPGGARIVNMSLGGPNQSRTERKGLDAIYSNGVLLVAAAGNDGNTQTSYPAGYSSVISVAAIDSNKLVASFSQQNSTVELSAPGVAVLSTVPFTDINTVGGLSGNHIEFSGRGSVTAQLVNGGLATSQNGAWSGKIVLVERGSISFNDKVQNVQASGGVACVIYNNEPGALFATLGTGNSSTIPAIGLSQADGVALLGSVGTNITVSSTFNYPASGYEAWDGTSMATPHVSGVAALVWSKYPAASPVQVRQALTNTAEDLGATGRDNAYGYGLVRAAAALTRLGELMGGGPPPPPPPAVLAITSSGVSSAKGKPGGFFVSFTTNKSATGTITTSPNVGTSSSSGTSFNVKFQGSPGTPYTITINATTGAESDSRVLYYTP